MVPSLQHLQNYQRMGDARMFARFAGRPLELVRMVRMELAGEPCAQLDATGDDGLMQSARLNG